MDYKQINGSLVDIFNRILIIEENSLKVSRFSDISLKEMHTIEIIGKRDNVTPSDIARELLLTLGTVTTSLNKLEKKGYVERTRSEKDRRVVYLSLTSKGRLLDRLHGKFHYDMIRKITADMDPSEIAALGKGLVNLHQWLEGLM